MPNCLHLSIQHDWTARVTVPAGFTRDRLPIGLQIVGQQLDDATVLRAAAAYEAAAPRRRWGYSQTASGRGAGVPR